MIPYNRKLTPTAKLLRKNMTAEEKHLWYDFLKRLPLTVKRQHSIKNYIVDFYIAQKKIVIEIDGAQHFSQPHEGKDRKRDMDLSTWGITVLRYTNGDINKNFNGVAEDILSRLGLSFTDLRNKTNTSSVTS